MEHTFRVVIRESELPGRQITADVMRDDGRIVRAGMWPDFAAIDCALLNECSSLGWDSSRYHAERRARFTEATR